MRNGPDEWLRQESLANALMARSRLSFTYDELAQAGEVMARARELAPALSGPLLSDAVLAMMAHKLGESGRALEVLSKAAVPHETSDQVEMVGLAGDIRFFRGDMDGARREYANADQLESGSGTAYRLARIAKATGDFDRAIEYFRKAELAPSQTPPFQHANTAMQIGAVELAQGNYDAARDWFVTADRLFPGYWLFEAHLAQAKAVSGDLPGAIAAMRKIAQQAPSAEVMDALAMLLRTDGQAAESREWAEKAGEVWQHRLTQLPEAAYGHALEHELVFGSPERALDLARRNLEARPFGESRVMMASALIVNGRFADAVSQLDLAEKSGWRSAPMYALRAQAKELSGRADEAEKDRQAALELNPLIFDGETPLIWFSHG